MSEPTGKAYTLTGFSDLLKIPPDRLGACLRDIEYGVTIVQLAFAEDEQAEQLAVIHWIDDGKSNAVITDESGETFLSLAVGAQKGPCAKQHVMATAVTEDGGRYVGTNECDNPQASCPREVQGYPRGLGYHLCKEVCQQQGHAEEMAIKAAKAAGASLVGAVVYLEGHDEVGGPGSSYPTSVTCPGCTDLCAMEGVAKVVTVPPPPCWCLTCRPMDAIADPGSVRMALCPACGYKRCPRANSCRHACTGSNLPGQPGSAYPWPTA